MSSSIHPRRGGPIHPVHEGTWQRLVGLYGYARAAQIVDGKDEATNADLAAWRGLGASKPSARKLVRR